MNDSKEHILIASLNLFLQKSFKEVTMKEIVDTTGLSKGAFYHYFNSKEQVFEEVIAHFYSDLILTDYSKFSQNSLLDFYSDYLNEKNNKLKTSKIVEKLGEHVITSNHYFLIFDALKMLPDFKKQRMKQQQDELKAWIKIIHIAKKNKEINSVMTDEQIAKLFIFSARGVGITCVMSDEFGRVKKEMKALWHALYNSLKIINQ